jgi:Tol biopolymer transport system component
MHATNLTHPGTFWSPDGSAIAYHSARDGGLWIVPARGGAARQIVPSGSDPAWSPDGRRIAFKSDEHADITPAGYGAQSGSKLGIVDADGANLQQLTRAGQPLGGHASPAFTHDGRFLAFSVFEGGPNNGVWILRLETLEVSPLHQGAGMYELAFAPDSSALYATGGESLLIRLPFDIARGQGTGQPDVIPVPGISSVRGLSISLERHLAVEIKDGPDIHAGVVDVQTGLLRRLTNVRGQTWVRSWSPDGKRIAAATFRNGLRARRVAR